MPVWWSHCTSSWFIAGVTTLQHPHSYSLYNHTAALEECVLVRWLDKLVICPTLPAASGKALHLAPSQTKLHADLAGQGWEGGGGREGRGGERGEVGEGRKGGLCLSVFKVQISRSEGGGQE